MVNLNVNESENVKVSEDGQIASVSRSVGIPIPAGLDGARYDKLSKLDLKSYQHDFIQAWNGVLYRLRAATDAESMYSGTPEVDHEAKYVRANAVFNFFVAALSTLECYCFALYEIGVTVDDTVFHPRTTEKDKKKITPNAARGAYNTYDNSCSLAKALDVLISSSKFVELDDVRNYLAHQGNPSTQYRKGFGASAGSDGQSSTIKAHQLEYDENTLKTRLTWLTDELNTLLQATEEFVKNQGLKHSV